MKAIYNGEIVDDFLEISLSDRGLNFGDGIFETMVYNEGKVQYLEYHLERLMLGCQVLGIELSGTFLNTLPVQLKKIAVLNGLEQARIKLSVWRKSDSGTGYGFKSSQYHFLLQCKAFFPAKKYIENASFSKDIQLVFNKLAGVKTMSALPYVLAAKERQERRLDELVLLSNKGEISECVASNIFWRKETSWFTPALSTGCLAGVARRAILSHASGSGVFIQEVQSPKDALLQADDAVATNVTGIRQFKQLDEHEFELQALPDWMYV